MRTLSLIEVEQVFGAGVVNLVDPAKCNQNKATSFADHSQAYNIPEFSYIPDCSHPIHQMTITELLAEEA